MLEKKTLESPLDAKEIKPVNPKGKQPWSWSANTLAIWCKEPTHWNRPWYSERLRVGIEHGNRGWDGWMASLTQWTWVCANSRRWWRTGKAGGLQSMGLPKSWTWLSDWTTTTEDHLCEDFLLHPNSCRRSQVIVRNTWTMCQLGSHFFDFQLLLLSFLFHTCYLFDGHSLHHQNLNIFLSNWNVFLLHLLFGFFWISSHLSPPLYAGYQHPSILIVCRTDIRICSLNDFYFSSSLRAKTSSQNKFYFQSFQLSFLTL